MSWKRREISKRKFCVKTKNRRRLCCQCILRFFFHFFLRFCCQCMLRFSFQFFFRVWVAKVIPRYPYILFNNVKKCITQYIKVYSGMSENTSLNAKRWHSEHSRLYHTVLESDIISFQKIVVNTVKYQI